MTKAELIAASVARAEQMAAMYREGQTLEKIGEVYDISRERVRQLLAKVGVTRKEGGASLVAAARRAARKSSINERSLARRGLSHEEFVAMPTRAKRAYIQQKANAGRRGIEWNLNLAEWWDIWQKSGKWELRGRGEGYCMGRSGDAGTYAVGNVYICTIGQNFSDSYIWRPAAKRNRPWVKTYDYNGEALTAAQLAKIAGMRVGTMHARLASGWSPVDAVEIPITPNKTHLRRLQSEQRA